MALERGHHLGPYEILSLLGSGGMGDVYRARDTTLKRDVAIKVLSEEFATATDRLARLEREAHLLASLNHHFYLKASTGEARLAKCTTSGRRAKGS